LQRGLERKIGGDGVRVDLKGKILFPSKNALWGKKKVQKSHLEEDCFEEKGGVRGTPHWDSLDSQSAGGN